MLMLWWEMLILEKILMSLSQRDYYGNMGREVRRYWVFTVWCWKKWMSWIKSCLYHSRNPDRGNDAVFWLGIEGGKVKGYGRAFLALVHPLKCTHSSPSYNKSVISPLVCRFSSCEFEFHSISKHIWHLFIIVLLFLSKHLFVYLFINNNITICSFEFV